MNVLGIVITPAGGCADWPLMRQRYATDGSSRHGAASAASPVRGHDVGARRGLRCGPGGFCREGHGPPGERRRLLDGRPSGHGVRFPAGPLGPPDTSRWASTRRPLPATRMPAPGCWRRLRSPLAGVMPALPGQLTLQKSRSRTCRVSQAHLNVRPKGIQMRIHIGSRRGAHRAPGTVIARKTRVAPQQPQASKKHTDNRIVLLGIGLSAVARLLRDPGFQARVITGIIGLAVLGRAVRENQARTVQRLIAWDKRHQPQNQG